MHPILFYIGNFPIASYGVMIVVGIGVALLLALHYAKQQGIPSDFIYDICFVALLSGFVGGRLLFIWLNLGEFKKDPLSLIFSRTGFVFMGGLFLAIPASIWIIRRRQMPMWVVADVVAPSLAIAHAFGRIGCFLAGCCYGGVCREDFPLGVSYPRLVNKAGDIITFSYLDQLHHGLIESTATRTLSVYPSQLFESAALFLICATLVLVWRKRRFTGQIFTLYLFLYGTARFALEFLRGDSERGLFFGKTISTSQIFSLIAIAGAAVLWIKLRAKAPEIGMRPRAAHVK